MLGAVKIVPADCSWWSMLVHDMHTQVGKWWFTIHAHKRHKQCLPGLMPTSSLQRMAFSAMYLHHLYPLQRLHIDREQKQGHFGWR